MCGVFWVFFVCFLCVKSRNQPVKNGNSVFSRVFSWIELKALKLLLGTVIKNYNTFHSYTDNTQLYLSFPSNLAPVHTLSCTDEINCWMSRYYFIELNRNKTFIFVVIPSKSGILLWRSGE